MRKHSLRWFLLLVLIVAAGWLGWRVLRVDPLAVELYAVARGAVEATVANTRAGTVNACRRARIAPATSGQVVELPVREGDRVRADQVLLRLWNRDLETRVRLQEAEVTAQQARAQQACVSAEQAEREAQRVRSVRERGLVAEDVADKASANAESLAAVCTAERRAIAAAQARVAVARAELQRTVLRAPFNGIVAELNAELGAIVTPSPLGVPTPPAVDLIEEGCLYVSAPIDEVDAPAVKIGLPAHITLDAFPQRVFAGRVRRIAPYVLDVEKQARTVEVEVQFIDPEPVDALLPGYSADIEVVLASRNDTLRVPTEAVLPGGRVLVYNAETGRLDARAVAAGLANWRWTEVTKGLRAGEHIATTVTREGVQAGAAVVPAEAK